VTRRIAIALLLTIALPAVAATRAVRVTATVAPFLLQRVEGVPESMTVTPADVGAGWIEVTGVRLIVKTNDPAGYAIAFRTRASNFTDIDVRGLDEQVRFGKSGGVVVRRLERIAFLTWDLSFRIALPPDVVPGTYPFPIDVTAYRLSP
jgi:hypothetical protein